MLEAPGVDEALCITAGERFDLYLIDLKMPGKPGTELIRELSDSVPLRKMVVITAFPDLSESEELLSFGAVTVLRKPLSVDQLIRCAEDILGQKLPGEVNSL